MVLKLLSIKIKAAGVKNAGIKVSGTKFLGLKGVAFACALGALSACTAEKNIDGNPLLRKFQWFSYLEGGDFKASCTSNSANRYRLVYNGVYTEQVRIYDVFEDGLLMHTRVVLPADAKTFEVGSFSGLLNPWRGTFKDIELKLSDVNGLAKDLVDAGVFSVPNVGEELSSKGFFWTIAACHKGQYYFNGYAWPSENWSKLVFAERLFALDTIQIDLNQPRKTRTTRMMRKTKTSNVSRGKEFHLKVGENRLVGLGTLF